MQTASSMIRTCVTFPATITITLQAAPLIYTYIYVCVCARVYIHICVYIYIYIYIYMKKRYKGLQSKNKAMVKAILLGEVYSKIKTEQGSSSIKHLMTFSDPLTEKVLVNVH